jgi:hypothetical protein
MALLLHRSFDRNTNTAYEVHSLATSTSPAIATVGRNGTKGLRLTHNALFGTRAGAIWNIGVQAQTVITQWWVNPWEVGTNPTLFELRDNGTRQWHMVLQNDGIVTMDGTGTTFYMDHTVAHYLKVKVKVHASTGTIDVHLDGLPVVSLTGLDTQQTANAYATQVMFGSTAELALMQDIDDILVMDTSGTTFNDIMPDIHIQYRTPTGAGDETDFTPSTGTNFSCVDDTNGSGSTDSVSSSVIGDRDLYTMQDLTFAVGDIYGVSVSMFANKDDAGMRLIKGVAKHGGTALAGTEHGLTTTLGYYNSLFTTNPSTGLAWTIAEVNAMQAGMETSG